MVRSKPGSSKEKSHGPLRFSVNYVQVLSRVPRKPPVLHLRGLDEGRRYRFTETGEDKTGPPPLAQFSSSRPGKSRSSRSCSS